MSDQVFYEKLFKALRSLSHVIGSMTEAIAKESVRELDAPPPTSEGQASSKPSWWPKNPYKINADPCCTHYDVWEAASFAIWEAAKRNAGGPPLSEPKPERPTMDWSLLPGLANKWVAMDEDGQWFAYSERPWIGGEFWTISDNDTEWAVIPGDYAPRWSGDWKESLTEVPHPTDSVARRPSL